MFDEIEKEYQSKSQAKRFSDYYWPRVLIVVLVAIILNFIFSKYHWLLYGCAIIFFMFIVGFFFLKEYHHAHKTIKTVRESRSFSTKYAAYSKADHTQRIDGLIASLARHNICTKSDIKLALDFFQSRLPANTKPKLLDWISTTIIALVSIIIITYDSSINTINIHRFFNVFAPSVVVALLLLTPFIIARLIFISISQSHDKMDTGLIQDLAYIYINFDKYQEKLKRSSK